MPTAENNAFTYLALSGIGVQPYSARGLTQQLAAIQQANQMRRTVNGKLVDISMEQFRLYTTTITGNDMEPPVCDGVWPGRQVIVDCISELVRPAGSPRFRNMVPGSEYTKDGFTHYRPRLVMRVISLDRSDAEYPHTTSWTLVMEEEQLPTLTP